MDDKQVMESAKAKLEESESDGNTLPVFILLLVVPLVIVSCILLYMYLSYQPMPDNNIRYPVVTYSGDLITNEEVHATKKTGVLLKKHIQAQPHCTTLKRLKEILKEIPVRLNVEGERDDNREQTLEFSVTDQTTAEPKAYFVIYIAVGLLITSLVAAFVDVYKVKGKPSKMKRQLTKRCSLADLTVLRHSRRESMRKDSIIEEQRGPLKLLGAHPSSDRRRCSVPAYTTEMNYGCVSPRHGSRKSSLEYYCEDSQSYDVHRGRVVRLIRRF